MVLEAVFWIMRTVAPLQALPPQFGNGSTVYRRVLDCAKAGVFERMVNGLSDAPEFEVGLVNATLVKLHGHGLGAQGALFVRR